MKIKNILLKLHWILSSQFGVDLYKFFSSFKGLVSYYVDRRAFSKVYSGRVVFMPCLHDRYEEAGTTKSEYFWQDLIVAREIYSANPIKHVDIGSRFDGFVAHIASFRECEVFDVRPIYKSVPGVVFRQADLMNVDTLPLNTQEGYCDSISCLHALEHFGLGRYGDSINPQGYRLGIENMSKLLRVGGVFYLSTPIGLERVEFNSNRVFDPRELVKIASANGLELKSLSVFQPKKGIHKLDLTDEVLAQLSTEHYNLGIFTFIKISQENLD